MKETLKSYIYYPLDLDGMLIRICEKCADDLPMDHGDFWELDLKSRFKCDNCKTEFNINALKR